ncbi:MAG: class I SAM-dependent methyltransferase [Halanaeroarchaeum sp.]
MTDHTFDPASADKLEDVERYRYLSRDELIGALTLDGTESVVDLGSGTGFYTREVAPYADRVWAVDVQPRMHQEFRSIGVPDTVTLVAAGVADTPFDASSIDAAYSTMTFHEFVSDASLAEIRRILRPGARFVVADWSVEGTGERGPPLDARFGPSDAADRIEAAGFEVRRADGRPETFVVVATAP